MIRLWVIGLGILSLSLVACFTVQAQTTDPGNWSCGSGQALAIIGEEATVTDDMVGGTTLTYEWVVLTQPVLGSAVILAPTELVTGVCFSTEGLYTLELTVTDAMGARGSDTLQVIVKAAVPLFSPPCGDLGDGDNNGLVDILDYSLVVRYFGEIVGSDLVLQRLDINLDGVIDSVEASAISAYIHGLITTFPGCTGTFL